LRTIYLDQNSTTPMLPDVVAAMAECMTAGYGNPASQHAAGRLARKRLEDAREAIAAAVGANLGDRAADRLVFTSGGTESNQLAILGMAAGQQRAGDDQPHEAIVSSIEHPSVMGAADALVRRGWRVHRVKVDQNGVVQIDHLRELLNQRTRLVSAMLANNETGVIQPVRELAAVCQAAGVPLHTDASQIVGKLPVDFRELGVAAMTIAAHKFHGPIGIGAIVLRHDVQIEAQWQGGFQQLGLRPGTESVALAVGMQTALAPFSGRACPPSGGRKDQRPGVGSQESGISIRQSHLQTLRDRLEAGLRTLYPPLVINGAGAPRLPNTSNVAFVGRDRQQLLVAFDLAGIACSTGSACASGSSEPSPVLKAMGLPPEVIASSLRFSVGVTTTAEEIDEAVRRIKEGLGTRG
jgi:cysteine desulfurase